MKIKNHQELLRKKKLLKEAILIQENQIKDNAFTNTFSRFKGYNANRKLLSIGSDNHGKVNPKIEQGVDLALTTLSSQLLKGRNLGAFPKLAIGIGILVTGKLIAGKIDQYVSKKNTKSIE
ncbi:hypothetical protein UJ101_02189 [Flavobacteriaceae bacterium UJ101]|nr:hypothetical protein UJ101_02189 [Flavobacteriaceae bacterium UJ101]